MGGTVPSGGLQAAGAGGLTQIALPPGTAALAGSVPGPSGPAPASGQAVTSYFLVTGGRRYGLASPAVAAILGYRLSQRTLVPAGVIDLIPLGSALDPAMAKRLATG